MAQVTRTKAFIGAAANRSAASGGTYPSVTLAPTGQTMTGDWATNTGGVEFWQSLTNDFGFSDGFSVEKNDLTGEDSGTLEFALASSGTISSIVWEAIGQSVPTSANVSVALSADNITFTATQTVTFASTITNALTFSGLSYSSPAKIYVNLNNAGNTANTIALGSTHIKINP